MAEEISVIIPAYNEGEKPKKLVKEIEEDFSLSEEFKIDEIFLLLSGDKNYLEGIKKESEVTVNIEKSDKREGKARAINRALHKLDSKYLLLVSADIEIKEGAARKLTESLDKRSIGVVTGRPKPILEDSSFREYFIELIWELHDFISESEPKAGEIMAFRNVVERIPEDTAADEEYLKIKIMRQGLDSEYRKDAVVYNKGPKSLKDLFEQRRRVYIGHLDLKDRTNYKTPSMDFMNLIKALKSYVGIHGVNTWFFLSLFFEFAARLDARVKYQILNQNPYKWKKVG